MNAKMGVIGTLKSLARLLRARPRVPVTLSGNALLQTILNRRSVRAFRAQAIPDEVFDAILEAGRLAPSTVNLQSWSFAVFNALAWQDTFGAPLPFRADRAVIVIADTFRDRQVLDAFPESPLVEYTIAVMNASLAAMNMNVAAEALGVASVMLSETGRSGILDAAYLKEKLALPERAIALMTIVFGYPRGPRPPMPPKLPTGQIAFSGRYPAPDRSVLQDWLAQMVAGYNASHPGSSFEKQLNVYQSKIGRAEKDLRAMVFGGENKD